MSAQDRAPVTAERPREAQRGPVMGGGPRRGSGGPGHGPALGRPVEKAKDFRGTLKRLAIYLAPRKWEVLIVTIFTVLSTFFSTISPRVMGRATTEIFNGMMAKARGIPGAGIDFGAVSRILMMLSGLYVASSVFSFIQQITMAKIAQTTVYDMRKHLSAKLQRLPLKYFDSRTHGEILSRVTNDMDTVGSTLQESLGRALSSAVTLIGVLVMMLSINLLMTLIVLATLPLSIVITAQIARRSQRYFAGQQRILGELNGHVEEMYTGHGIVKAFSREEASIRRFREINEELAGFGWRAQFVSGVMMPAMGLVNNIGYVAVCVVGGVFVARRAMEIGDVQAFMNYARHFSQPIVQVASIANIIQSTIAAS